MFNDLTQRMREHLQFWRDSGAPPEPGIMTLEFDPDDLEVLLRRIDQLRECACGGCLSADATPELHTCQDGWIKDRVEALEEKLHHALDCWNQNMLPGTDWGKETKELLYGD